MKILQNTIVHYSLIIIFCLTLLLAGCRNEPENPEPPSAEDLPAANEPAPDTSTSSDPVDIVFLADKNICLIDLSAPENEIYGKWLDEHKRASIECSDDLLSRKYVEGRTTKFYLTETIYILEDNRSLFYVNEQTGEKRTALEGGIYHNDPSDYYNELDKYEIVLFEEKIDYSKFVYRKIVHSATYGCGIFNVSDFSDHPITFGGENIDYLDYIGIYGDCVYTFGSVGDELIGEMASYYFQTNIHTFETAPIVPVLAETSDAYFVNYSFSPDGANLAELYARPMTQDSDHGTNIFSYEIKLIDVESKHIAAVYNIYEENAAHFAHIYYIDNNTIYILEASAYGDNIAGYLLEVDVSVIER